MRWQEFLGADSPPTLTIRIGRTGHHPVQTHLLIYDIEGILVEERELKPSNPGTAFLQTVVFDELQPGLYHARLQAMLSCDTVLERRLDFVRLAPPLASTTVSARSTFGVIIEKQTDHPWRALAALVAQLGVKNIKLNLAENPFRSSLDEHSDYAHYMKQLVDSRCSLIGTFSPGLYQTPGLLSVSGTQSLVDLLSEPVENWREALTQVVTRYEILFRHWQLGIDGNRQVSQDQRLGEVVEKVRTELKTLIAKPTLAIPWWIHQTPNDAIPAADFLSLSIPTDVLPEDIPDYIGDLFFPAA